METIPQPAPAPTQAGRQDVAWFVATVFAALYGCNVLLLAVDDWPSSSTSHLKIWAAALFLVLPFALAVAAALRQVRDRLMGGNQNLLPALVLVNTAIWSVFLCLPTKDLVDRDLREVLVGLVPLASLAALGSVMPFSTRRLRAWDAAERLALACLVPVAVAFLCHFRGGALPDRQDLKFLVEATLAVTAAVLLGRKRPQAKLDPLDAAAVVLLLATVFSTNPAADVAYVQYHQNYCLGPVNSVLAGRSMLVDVNCQYGVAMVYFTAGLLKLLGMRPHYTPFTSVLMVLMGLEFAAVYLLARMSMRSRTLATLCGFAVLCLGRAGFSSEWDLAVYPMGPLRFGLPLVLLAAGILRRRRPSARFWAWLELGLVGLAGIWSVETFVYCLSAVAFPAVAESWVESDSLRGFLGRCLRCALDTLIAVCAALIALAAFTWVRSGELPHWGNYLSYMGHTTAEYPMDLWTPWILVPATLCLGLLALSLSSLVKRGVDPAHYLMLGVAGSAAAEMSYFFGRAYLGNLCSVAPLALLLFFYCLDRLWDRAQGAGALRWMVLPSGVFLVLALLWACWPVIMCRYSQSALCWAIGDAAALRGGPGLAPPPQFTRNYAPVASQPRVEAAVRMINTYAPRQREVAVFTPDEVEVRALSGRVNPFPVSYHYQDDDLPDYCDWVLSAPLPLKAGDVLISVQDAHKGFAEAPALEDQIYVRLMEAVKAQFKLEPLEYDPSGVWALRLAALDGPPVSKAP